jgi:lycopene beta-cyclase
MIRSQKFADKRILLIDKEQKDKNDRTWCFWEEKNGFFDELVYKKWDTISFLSNDYSSAMGIDPYQYKMIRGIDFYNFCFTEISKHSNIEVVTTKITSIVNSKEGARFFVGEEIFELGNGATIFNSIPELIADRTCKKRLLQHFKGWVIETDKPAFNPQQATLMDFRVQQNNGTAFAYLLPFTDKTALVEYTLFTKTLLAANQYDEGLGNYIRQFLQIDNYNIKEEEFGVIPMTDEKFPFVQDYIFNLGMAGGQTKASSGYTFQFIQKQSQQIADCLVAGQSLFTIRDSPKRFRFYDNTLLHILYNNTYPCDKIFSQLFKKNKPQQVLRFLDNETSLTQELKIISSLPTWPFLKAALKQL